MDPPGLLCITGLLRQVREGVSDVNWKVLLCIALMSVQVLGSGATAEVGQAVAAEGEEDLTTFCYLRAVVSPMAVSPASCITVSSSIVDRLLGYGPDGYENTVLRTADVALLFRSHGVPFNVLPSVRADAVPAFLFGVPVAIPVLVDDLEYVGSKMRNVFPDGGRTFHGMGGPPESSYVVAALFQHIDYAGKRLILTGDTPCSNWYAYSIGNLAFSMWNFPNGGGTSNDQISSAQYRFNNCNNLAFYEHKNFNHFYYGTHSTYKWLPCSGNLCQNFASVNFNDMASSVVIRQ